MSEYEAVRNALRPGTRQNLAAGLRQLGLKPGMVVIVHSSLSALGWVCGGPVAVIQALMDALTEESTLVMPAHSGEYSDPSKWEHPPVPESWWEEIRQTMPAFEPEVTPTRGMGVISETFRSFPGVLRSNHPAVSFTAWGKYARLVTDRHGLDYCLGETSPLARIYDLDGWVLLLGVGYANNTSFHLAQYRIHSPQFTLEGAPILVDGQRVWKTYHDVDTDPDRFGELGEDFEKQYPVIIGKVGSGQARLFRQRPAVDYAVKWLAEHKG